MPKSVFGWSYPPGCSGPPNYPEFCESCGQTNLDLCICPECTNCGGVGDPNCYKNHGLVYSQEQLDGQEKLRKQMEEEAEAERRYLEQITLED